MRVLVSGVSGFVGRRLVPELLRRGHEVTGIDLAPLADATGVRFIQGDAAHAGRVAGLLADCDHFVALAAQIGPVGWMHDRPYDALYGNLALAAAACNGAAAARAAGSLLRKVTFVSSSMVYEQATRWPSREGDEQEMPPPALGYGFSKLATERFALAAWEQHGLPYTIVRPFNVTGPGEPPGHAHVVTDLIRKVLSGQDPLRILGDGSQVRYLTHVDDIARGIAAAMESDAAACEDFNLAGREHATVLQLAQLAWDAVHPGVPLRYECDPAYPLDVRTRIPDSLKAERVLGWVATAPVAGMVAEVVAHECASLSVTEGAQGVV